MHRVIQFMQNILISFLNKFFPQSREFTITIKPICKILKRVARLAKVRFEISSRSEEDCHFAGDSVGSCKIIWKSR